MAAFCLNFSIYFPHKTIFRGPPFHYSYRFVRYCWAYTEFIVKFWVVKKPV